MENTLRRSLPSHFLNSFSQFCKDRDRITFTRGIIQYSTAESVKIQTMSHDSKLGTCSAGEEPTGGEDRAHISHSPTVYFTPLIRTCTAMQT